MRTVETCKCLSNCGTNKHVISCRHQYRILLMDPIMTDKHKWNFIIKLGRRIPDNYNRVSRIQIPILKLRKSYECVNIKEFVQLSLF